MPKFGLIFSVLLLASSSAAQSVTPATDAAAAAQIDQAGDDLREVTALAHRNLLSDEQLKAQLAALTQIRSQLDGALSTLTPHLRDADAGLVQLGPAPTLGQPGEPPETGAARAALVRARVVIDAEVKQARLLDVQSDQIAAAVNERLRHNFANRLWTRSRSVLDPGLWHEFAASMPTDIRHVGDALRDEAVAFGLALQRAGGAASLVFTFGLALVLVGPGRLFLTRWGRRWATVSAAPEPFRRSGLALWLFVVAIATVLLAGLGVRAALVSGGALTPIFTRLAGLILRGAVFAAALEGLGRAILSPGRSQWRIAPIPDDVVARLSPYPALIGLSAGLGSIVSGLNTALSASLSSSVASDFCAMSIELAVVGAALTTTARAREAHLAAPTAAARRARGARLPWVLAALAAWLALTAALIAVLVGYLALAGFLMRETVWIGAVLGLMFLLLRFTDELFPTLFAPKNRVGRLIETGLGLSRASMEQIGVLLAGLARLLLLLLGWTAILAPFGAGADDAVTKVTANGVTLHIGRVSISPGAVLGAVGLLLIGITATRAVRGWLETRYLPKTRLDIGVRTSASSAVTYLGVAIALLAAFAYLGVSLSQMALLAGALSVGIGFGLQSIIGNFVSGLILLAERPVAVGDWIAIGDLEGDVRRINIRATEIEMADKSKLIVPNSDLVSKTVRNVTHAGAMGRVRIVLKVDDAADAGVVRDLLLARLRGHPDVLPAPPPSVFLSDVRDGALEFTAFAYLAAPREALRVKSDLLFQILPDLKSNGVGLANIAPIVNVGVPDRAAAAAPIDTP